MAFTGFLFCLKYKIFYYERLEDTKGNDFCLCEISLGIVKKK